LLVASAVSLFLSVLSDSWTNTMLTGVYLLLIKFQGKVALYALPVTCFCLWFITNAVNSSDYVYTVSNELEVMWKERETIHCETLTQH
jgi:UDP-N-acetylmuramyl pentapeptide phosphotransferase/UDP-N-acetylglucosamine-1-phosphate transferase